ncbi:MAG: hypothetical protein R2873_09355 [Caldilineaceae bacterium]
MPPRNLTTRHCAGAQRSLSHWLRLLRPAHAALVLTLLMLIPDVLQAAPTEIHLTIDGKDEPSRVVRGVIEITGVADHRDFRKWQLDLLLDGEAETFLALGEDPEPEPAFLAAVDTTRYPDGEHMLRLRVVHSDMNYDEYTWRWSSPTSRLDRRRRRPPPRQRRPIHRRPPVRRPTSRPHSWRRHLRRRTQRRQRRHRRHRQHRHRRRVKRPPNRQRRHLRPPRRLYRRHPTAFSSTTPNRCRGH